MVERLNSTISQFLKKINKNEDWTNQLHHFIKGYRFSPHSQTKESPYYLLFKTDPRLPIEKKLKSIQIGNSKISELVNERLRKI